MYDSDPNVELFGAGSLSRAAAAHGFSAVEFFAPWCGHCQNFAPVWSAVAAEACSARPELLFAAVDCVRYNSLCRNMGIEGFPSVRVFGGGNQLRPSGTRLRRCPHGCDSAAEVLDDVLGTLRRLSASAAGSLPASAEALAARSNASHCHTRRSAAVPRKAGGTRTPRQSSLAPGEAPSELALLPRPLDDAASAVLYGFQMELPRGDFTDARRVQALRAWLELLATALPGEPNRASMRTLHAMLSGGDLSAVGWTAALRHMPRPLLPLGAATGQITWRACRGWAPDSRGYVRQRRAL